MFHDKRLRPSALLIAVLPPDFLARVLIQYSDERARFGIEVQDETIAGQCGRGPLAEFQSHLHRRKILTPDELAIEVVTEDSARTEECVDPFAVCGRTV